MFARRSTRNARRSRTAVTRRTGAPAAHSRSAPPRCPTSAPEPAALRTRPPAPAEKTSRNSSDPWRRASPPHSNCSTSSDARPQSSGYVSGGEQRGERAFLLAPDPRPVPHSRVQSSPVQSRPDQTFEGTARSMSAGCVYDMTSFELRCYNSVRARVSRSAALERCRHTVYHYSIHIALHWKYNT